MMRVQACGRRNFCFCDVTPQEESKSFKLTKGLEHVTGKLGLGQDNGTLTQLRKEEKKKKAQNI